MRGMNGPNGAAMLGKPEISLYQTRSIFMNLVKPLFALMLVANMPWAFAGENRQHGAHEHGVGKLDIAQEGGALQLELDSPAINIVGFEHEPNSEDDHHALERALAQLKKGAGLFTLPKSANCRLVDADADTPLMDHDEEEAHHESEHHDEHAEHAGHHKHEHEPGHDRAHSDITARWRFDCAHPDALDRLGVNLFKAFPLTERLQVQYITERGQGAAVLNALQSELRF